MKKVIVDTGYWLGLFDERDQHHADAEKKNIDFGFIDIVMPWPIMYETLRSRFVKNKNPLIYFERLLKKSRIEYIENAKYNSDAFELSLKSTLHMNRPLSMIDCLIRLMIEDPALNINCLITFNTGDFVDVCKRKGVEIL